MNNQRPRRGVAVLIAIAVLSLIVVAISLAAKANLSARREARRVTARVQADYLALSGLDLAKAKLADDAAYAGERWQIEPSDLGGRDAGMITIEISADPNDASARNIAVVAEYPFGETASSTNRARVSRLWKPAANTGETP